MKLRLLVLAAIITMTQPAFALTHRSYAARAEFARSHPCPSTGAHKPNKCTGYIIDHIKPLCKGGADAPSNMQWQTVAEAKAKDKWECKK